MGALGVLLVLLSALSISICQGDPSTVSVVLLGRKGSGITSTVRQILGSKTSIHAAEEAVASTDILEYTLRIPQTTGEHHFDYLRLIDVPGLELGENLEHDAEILSTLKSYLHDEGAPTFFLVVFRIDDKTIAEPNSPLAQLLKGVEFLQQSLFQTTTDNTLFLLTRLLNEPPDTQANPQKRIDEFRQIIRKVTTLPNDVEILVGDNKPDPATTVVEKGFTKLPNNELYPKNILDKLLAVSEKSTVIQSEKLDDVKHVLNYLIDTRETAELHTKELVAHASDEEVFESDLEAFEFLLRQNDLKLPDNEIQRFLRSTYEAQDANTQISSCVQLRALQVTLRNLNVERIDQLPQTITELVHLFQKDVDGVMTSKYSLFYLKQALGLEVPDYPSDSLIVGNGYDLIHDRILKKSPFLKNSNKRPSSSLGYQFPDFVECERLADVEEVVLANTTDSLKAYHEERLKLLTFPEKENVGLDHLKGDKKPFLNLNYAETGKLAAVKEVRLLECKMTVENDTIAITDDSFITLVNSLPTLNTSDPVAVEKWNLLLRTYGTHVITKSFGGGCYQGLLSLDGESNTIQKENADEILNSIVEFKDLNTPQKDNNGKRSLVYQFHVVEDENIDPRISRIDEVSENVRNIILNDWKLNLNLQFEMLKNELELVPLSQVVGVINTSKQADAEAATRLLLQGNLKSEREAKRAELSPQERRILVRNQGMLLRQLNSEKTSQKLKRFNEFVDEATLKREDAD